MTPCPFCRELLPEEARVCKFCHKPLVKRCPLCAEEIQATAVKCRWCGSAIGDAPVSGRPGGGAPSGPLGEERSVAVTIVLTLITCGVYGLVVMYRMGEELNAHLGRREVNPAVDLLLSVVTCGLWAIYLMYRYPRILQEIQAAEGRTGADIGVACLVLSIFGFSFVAVGILQDELNKHWAQHRAGGG